MKMVFELIPSSINDSGVINFLTKHWGSKLIVSRGKITDASKISRIIIKGEGDKIIGLATFSINKGESSCELVSIDVEEQREGLGTKIIKLVEKTAKENDVKRMWLITTNDNYEAGIFYIKNGYRLVNIFKDALDVSRKLKPQIPLTGKYDIPLKDEWEFEKFLK